VGEEPFPSQGAPVALQMDWLSFFALPLVAVVREVQLEGVEVSGRGPSFAFKAMISGRLSGAVASLLYRSSPPPSGFQNARVFCKLRATKLWFL